MAVERFPRLFLDASFLVALYGLQDAMHDRAEELLTEADETRAELCTIWDCMSEALTVLRRHFGWRAAAALAKSTEDLTFVGYDTTHRLAALELFLARSKSTRLSYVDALCAVVVREVLDHAPALSFDRDFRSLGLTVVS